MIFNDTGKIIDDLYMVGHPAMPVYLLDGSKPAVFDAGLAFLGRMYVDGIRQFIGQRDLHYCFLSHSHFDHCGSVAVLRKAYPNLKVVASANVRRVLGRPNAVALMGELTRAAEQLSGKIGIEADRFDPFEPFEVDIALSDGDRLELSDELILEAMETPGHTRDSLSYFIPRNNILLCSEAAGIPDAAGYVVSEALVDYDQYFKSLMRLSRVNCEVLCLGHRQALTGMDVRRYFQQSIADCRHFLKLVESALIEFDGDVQKVISRVKAVEYDPVPEPKQIEAAYLINLEAKVRVIKKRMDERGLSPEIAN